MINFDGKIVQFGFGAVGKSFYEKIAKEIKFNENKYFVISMDKQEFTAYINLGELFLILYKQKLQKIIFKKYLENY